MRNVFPILENLHSLKKDVFNIPLYASGSGENDLPNIAFAQASETNQIQATIIENTEDIALSGGDLVRLAFKNLRELPLQWQQKKLLNQDILALESTWAAEKILDNAFLNQASELLKSPKILVAIPKRGLILAARFTQTDADIAFCTYAFESYEDMGSTPLSDKLFIVENGQISGLSDVKPMKAKFSIDHDLLHDDTMVINVKKDISSKIVKMAYINGFESYSVTLGAQDYEDFTNAAYQIILDILAKNQQNPSFNGLIEFHILSEWLPKSKEFDNTLTTFLDRLKNQSTLAKSANMMRKDIAITFIHLSDLQTGNSHLKHRLKIFSTI
jgi:hypothetical protein